MTQLSDTPYQAVHKFGRNPEVDTATAAKTDIRLRVLSSSANGVSVNGGFDLQLRA